MGKAPQRDTAAELRELTREANGLLKDLRRERRELEERLKDFTPAIQAEIKAAVAYELDRMKTEVRDQTERATAAVFRRFDTIADVLLGSNKGGTSKPPLAEMAEAWLNQQPPELRVSISRQVKANIERETRAVRAATGGKPTSPADYMEAETHEDDGVR